MWRKDDEDGPLTRASKLIGQQNQDRHDKVQKPDQDEPQPLPALRTFMVHLHGPICNHFDTPLMVTCHSVSNNEGDLVFNEYIEVNVQGQKGLGLLTRLILARGTYLACIDKVDGKSMVM